MIAVLSNVNCDGIIRRIKKTVPCRDGVGYGGIIETLLDPEMQGSQGGEAIDTVFVIVDLREFVQLSPDYRPRIENFFFYFEKALKSGFRYFISDGHYYLPEEISFRGDGIARSSEHFWNETLYRFCGEHDNCYVFPFSRLVCREGEKNFYSDFLWYQGSVRYSLNGEKMICREIERAFLACRGETKKALVLDLDNTLWGGVAGEDGLDGVKLADSGPGKAYKEFQRTLKYMKEAGVILCVASKNNEEDAWQIIEKHPHMLLRREDFAAYRINWENKSGNIRDMARQLNIGLSSMVFIDDNPNERAEVKALLPELTVPEFPASANDLQLFSDTILRTCFSRLSVTAEDKNKTEMYHAMSRINEARSTAADYPSFLKSLEIKVTRKDPKESFERVAQLVAKTNQFNTTVTRYTPAELDTMLSDPDWMVYLYEVRDKFANHGLCAEAFVYAKDTAEIRNFIMSCRVMGRNIEYGILDDIREDLKRRGFDSVKAKFMKGPKNAPVEFLFDRAGYHPETTDGGEQEKRYEKSTEEAGATESFYGELRHEV